jgi:hypothetical protein
MWLNKDNQALLKEKNEFVSFRKAFDNGNDINSD